MQLGRFVACSSCWWQERIQVWADQLAPTPLTAKSRKFSLFWGYISQFPPISTLGPSFCKSWIWPCGGARRLVIFVAGFKIHRPMKCLFTNVELKMENKHYFLASRWKATVCRHSTQYIRLRTSHGHIDNLWLTTDKCVSCKTLLALHFHVLLNTLYTAVHLTSHC